MRIAYFVNEFPAFSQPFVLNQVIGAIAAGHDVDIFAAQRVEGAEKNSLVQQHRLMERIEYTTLPAGRYLARLGAALATLFNPTYRGSRRPLLRALNFFRYGRDAASLRLFFQCRHVAHRAPYDIVHCQFGTLGPHALRLRDLGALSGRLVVSFRGYDATKFVNEHPHCYDDLFVRGDMFLPVSNGLRARLIELGCPAAKIQVLHSGLDCQQFRFKERRGPALGEPVQIISVGRFVEKKGLRYGIQAMALLRKQGLDARYVVIGDGELRTDLEKLIDTLQLGDKVTLKGWQRHDEVVTLMDNAHILLAPSITAADGDQEGIPNVVKEAMALGLPVISTDHSGIPELVDDGVSGFLVPEKDPVAIAQRVTQLCARTENWAAIGRSARTKVETEFDIVRLNDRLLTLYVQLATAASPK